MNNTKKKTKRTLSLVAIFIVATLVVGTFAATTTTKTAFAASNNSGNTITAQINSQSATQSGFDNKQEQEAQNTICTHPGDNASCVSEGQAAAAAQPVKKTCEQCFTTLLNPQQISSVLRIVSNQPSLADLCALLEQHVLDEATFRIVLTQAQVSGTTANELIACLKDAGVVFPIE